MSVELNKVVDDEPEPINLKIGQELEIAFLIPPDGEIVVRQEPAAGKPVKVIMACIEGPGHPLRRAHG